MNARQLFATSKAFLRLAEPIVELNDDSQFEDYLNRENVLLDEEIAKYDNLNELEISEKLQRTLSFLRRYQEVSFKLDHTMNGYTATIDLGDNKESFSGSMRHVLVRSLLFLQELAYEV